MLTSNVDQNPVEFRTGGRRSRLCALVLATSLLGLSACAPLPVTIVSTVIDGISYASTGKSSTDHLLSGVADKDCALHRSIQGEAICVPFADNPAVPHEVAFVAGPGGIDRLVHPAENFPPM